MRLTYDAPFRIQNARVFFEKNIFPAHPNLYPNRGSSVHAADRPSWQTQPAIIPTIPPPTPFPYSSTLRYLEPGTSPTLPPPFPHSPTPFSHPTTSFPHPYIIPAPLHHSRTPTSFPHPPTSFPHPPTPFPHPPTSFPHPPTSFPRRRESLPPARIASGSQQTRRIAPLGVAAPEPSYQETKRNHNSANSFTRMRQEDRMSANAPSMKTVSASHEAR